MRLTRIAMASAVAALISLTSYGFAEATAATGSVSGTVTTSDQKPAAGVTVRINLDPKVHTTPTAADGDKTPPDGAKKKKAMGLTATTDDKGAFKIENVPVGQYIVSANLKGTGKAKVNVAVLAGKDAAVTLQLAPVTAKPKN